MSMGVKERLQTSASEKVGESLQMLIREELQTEEVAGPAGLTLLDDSAMHRLKAHHSCVEAATGLR